MENKKILIVSNNHFFGGGEQFIINISVDIMKYFDVYFIVKDTELFERLPENRRMLFQTNSFFGQIKEVNSVIFSMKIYAVVLNGGRTLYFPPFINRTAKIVMYRHTTTTYYDNKLKKNFYKLLIHIGYLFAQKVIHVSKYSLSEQKWRRKISVYIYHGIQLMPYRKINTVKPLQILFVGRTDLSKGIDIIVNAFKEIHEDIAILHIVGTGEYDGYIKNAMKNNIIYHGFQKDTAYYYNSFDIFISLPIFEAFGLTILEAMNHSMPIITTKAGAIPEIVHEKNGFFVQRTVSDVVNLINDISFDTTKLEDMGKQSHEIVKNMFQKSKMIENIVEVLNTLS